ncbi:hypothetical protein [Actinoplanes sp. NPDC089786]|uniref:hypothetical protein n=1 Tax=Actinoplanes sp. NPDC089786 TaxID=3155185 RepID=UPI003421C873
MRPVTGGLIRGGLVRGGLVCGGITAAALCVPLGLLDEYQVDDYSDMDPVIGVFGGLLLGAVAAALTRLVHSRPKAHAVVPLFLVPGVLAPLTLGLERNRLEAAVLWSAVAVAIHLLVATRRRRWAVPAVVLVTTLGAGATWALQERWRAQEFEAMSVPLYVPEVPGYRLTGTHAGRSMLIERLEKDRRALDVSVDRAYPGCPTRTDAEVTQICLPDGYVVTLHAVFPTGTVGVREATAAEMARHPDKVGLSEPD